MGGGEFFDFLKAKNEEIFKKNIFWDLYRTKTVYPFCVEKKY